MDILKGKGWCNMENKKNTKNEQAKNSTLEDLYDDGNIPEIDLPQDVEPLPESTRPRKDGPGGD